MKGSGQWSWKAHEHNSVNKDIREIPRICLAANAFFVHSRDFPHRVILSYKVSLIHTFVSANGHDWYVDNICEYVG